MGTVSPLPPISDAKSAMMHTPADGRHNRYRVAQTLNQWFLFGQRQDNRRDKSLQLTVAEKPLIAKA